MTRINEIQNRIKEMNGGQFQKLCDEYLFRSRNFVKYTPLGSQDGTNNPTKGVPDSYSLHEDGTYTFVMHGKYSSNHIAKLQKDIKDCLNEEKVGIDKSRIRKIICFHTSTNITVKNLEDILDLIENVEIELIDLGTLSYSLEKNYPGIVRDYLDIAVDSGQIYTILDFIVAYDKNGMAAPLDIAFKFREKELGKLREAVRFNEATLISGASGVGKTKIALEVCAEYERAGYEVICIKNNSLSLYEDFRIALSGKDKIVVLFDDINQTSNLEAILDTILLNFEKSDIRIIATVRDYAREKVLDLFSKFKSFSEQKISNFESDEIKKILEECLDIKNTNFQDRIAIIAKGNIRLAILAGKLAKEDVEHLNNATDIFKSYYGKVFEEGNLSTETQKVLFIISLMNTVRVGDDELGELLLNDFNISWEKFREICLNLNEKEIVDFYLEEVVKINDQSFSNYLLEYALIEKKFISISRLLELGLTIKRDKIIYALNTLYQLFPSSETRDYLSEQINDSWNKISLDEEDIFLESFHSFNYSKSLKILKDKIESMPDVDFAISKEYFDKQKIHQNITSKEILILSNFKYTPYFQEAIELMIMAFNQNQSLFMDVYFAMKNWIYDKHSFDYDCKKELEFINALFTLREQENYNFDFLILELLDEMLVCSGSITEQGDKPYLISIGQFTISLTEGVKNLRKRLWKILSTIYEKEKTRNRVESILIKYHWNGITERSAKILEFDYSCISKEFLNNWKQPTLEQALIMKKLEEFANTLEVDIDDSFKSYIKNKEYKYYEVISSREYRENFREWKNQQEQQIISKVSLYTFDDYKELIDIASKIEKNKLFSDFDLSENLVIALRSSSDDLLSKVLEYYFGTGAPLANQGIVYDMIRRIGFNKTISMINKYNFQAKNIFLRMTWEYLPPEMVSEDKTQMLLDFIGSQVEQNNPSIPSIGVVLKFKQFDENILNKVCNELIELSKVNSNIVHDFLIEYYDNVDELLKIFQKNLEQLEQLYLNSGGINFDYDGELLISIVRKDPGFWDLYTQYLVTKDLFNHENKGVFSKIWLFENYKELIDVAFENIINHTKKYFGSERYEIIFPNKSVSNEAVNTRVQEWLYEYIEKNYNESKLMHKIFFHYISLQSEDLRLGYLEQFLKYNKKFEDFKNLSILPTSFSWSGSEIPLLDRDITFLDILIKSDFLRGIKFIDHREYLDSYKAALMKRKKEVRVKEFREER